jgi:hypothetical protein
MMKISTIIASTFLIISLSINQLYSQIGISSTNLAPAASAMLDVSATNKGILIPRMPTSIREVIQSPAAGLIVYDTDFKELFIFNGQWQQATIANGSISNNAYLIPTFENNWVNYGADNYSPAKYYKDQFGVVHLQGMVKSGGIPSAIFTLPEGYRPIENRIFPVASGGYFGQIAVFTDGQVYFFVGYTDPYVSLEGISFRVD